MKSFEVREGTAGLTLGDIEHVLIPGRGRDATGSSLSQASRMRVLHAFALYVEQRIGDRGGRIVCSGYKTPGDLHGDRWSPADSSDEVFVGVPEADSMT